MKEWIERFKKRALDSLKINRYNIHASNVLTLIAEIESLEKDKNYYKQNLIREQHDRQKQCETLTERIKQLQAVCEAAVEYLKGREKEEPFQIVARKLEKLQQALTARGKK